MSQFCLPDLGEGLSDAEIREWHVAPGDDISADSPLVSVETAKAIVEVPSPFTGKVIACHAKPGDTVDVGSLLVDIQTKGEELGSETPQRADSGTVVGRMDNDTHILADDSATVNHANATSSRAKATPAIRILAHQLGVNLDKLTGTGPGGAITRKDLESAASAPDANSHTHVEPLSNVDKVMAEAMAKSHREVVPVTIIDDADITNWPAKVDMTVKVIAAISHACRIEGHLNAHFNADALTRTLFDDVHLGLALDSEHGLFVPVIHNAESLSETDLRTHIDTYKAKAHTRELTVEELQGASIVLSNFGVIGGRYANPIVVPPTVAIIGIGHLFERASDEQQASHQRWLPISVTFDHRAVTGGQASKFISAMVNYLNDLY